MASWQFDFRLLPRLGVERRYRAIPLEIASEIIDEETLWADVSLTSELREQFSRILPPLNAWTADVERWGFEDGNRIDVVSHNDAIVDILVRVDVRNISQVFLSSVLQIARQNDWLVRTGGGGVSRPSRSRLLFSIQTSQAFRFVQNPVEFLEALGRARNDDEN